MANFLFLGEFPNLGNIPYLGTTYYTINNPHMKYFVTTTIPGTVLDDPAKCLIKCAQLALPKPCVAVEIGGTLVIKENTGFHLLNIHRDELLRCITELEKEFGYEALRQAVVLEGDSCAPLVPKMVKDYLNGELVIESVMYLPVDRTYLPFIILGKKVITTKQEVEHELSGEVRLS